LLYSGERWIKMRRTVYEMIYARLQQMGIIDESRKNAR
jgi:hypothetical protein